MSCFIIMVMLKILHLLRLVTMQIRHQWEKNPSFVLRLYVWFFRQSDL